MKLHLPLFAILATVTLAGCHSASAAQVAAEQMDAEIPAQEFSVTYKDHGAFRGQGTSCTTLQFSDDAFLEKSRKKAYGDPCPWTRIHKISFMVFTTAITWVHR